MKPLILFDCSKEKKIKRLSQIDLFSASGNVVREISFFFFFTRHVNSHLLTLPLPSMQTTVPKLVPIPCPNSPDTKAKV